MKCLNLFSYFSTSVNCLLSLLAVCSLAPSQKTLSWGLSPHFLMPQTRVSNDKVDPCMCHPLAAFKEQRSLFHPGADASVYSHASHSLSQYRIFSLNRMHIQSKSSISCATRHRHSFRGFSVSGTAFPDVWNLPCAKCKEWKRGSLGKLSHAPLPECEDATTVSTIGATLPIQSGIVQRERKGVSACESLSRGAVHQPASSTDPSYWLGCMQWHGKAPFHWCNGIRGRWSIRDIIWLTWRTCTTLLACANETGSDPDLSTVHGWRGYTGTLMPLADPPLLDSWCSKAGSTNDGVNMMLSCYCEIDTQDPNHTSLPQCLLTVPITSLSIEQLRLWVIWAWMGKCIFVCVIWGNWCRSYLGKLYIIHVQTPCDCV